MASLFASVTSEEIIQIEFCVACEQAPSEVGKKKSASESERRDSASEAS